MYEKLGPPGVLVHLKDFRPTSIGILPCDLQGSICGDSGIYIIGTPRVNTHDFSSDHVAESIINETRTNDKKSYND